MQPVVTCVGALVQCYNCCPICLVNLDGREIILLVSFCIEA